MSSEIKRNKKKQSTKQSKLSEAVELQVIPERGWGKANIATDLPSAPKKHAVFNKSTHPAPFENKNTTPPEKKVEDKELPPFRSTLTLDELLFLRNLQKEKIESYPVSVSELKIHVERYKQKYGIKIIINGETTWGEARNASRIELHKKIIELEDETLGYPRYINDIWRLRECFSWNCSWNSSTKSNYNYYFRDEYTGIEFSPDEGGYEVVNMLWKISDASKESTELATETLAAVHQLFLKLPNKAQTKLKSGVKKYLRELWGQLNLTHAEMLQEVDIIQRSLKKDEVVGYIYTNGDITEAGKHVEGILITSEFLIKPLVWSYPKNIKASTFTPPTTKHLLPEHFPKKVFYDSDISALGPPFSITAIEIDEDECDENGDALEWATYGPYPPVAQAGLYECPAFLLKGLKVFLKNDAALLKNFSLLIPYFNNTGEVCYFLFPPPDVLYYSQSNSYNAAICSLLEDTDSVNVTCSTIDDWSRNDKEIFSFTTVKALLKESIITGKRNATNEWVAKHNEEILGTLDAFRANWLARYAQVELRRKKMTHAEYNRALLYATYQFHTKALEAQEKTSTEISELVTPVKLIADSPVKSDDKLQFKDITESRSSSSLSSSTSISIPIVGSPSMASVSLVPIQTVGLSQYSVDRFEQEFNPEAVVEDIPLLITEPQSKQDLKEGGISAGKAVLQPGDEKNVHFYYQSIRRKCGVGQLVSLSKKKQDIYGAIAEVVETDIYGGIENGNKLKGVKGKLIERLAPYYLQIAINLRAAMGSGTYDSGMFYFVAAMDVHERMVKAMSDFLHEESMDMFTYAMLEQLISGLPKKLSNQLEQSALGLLTQPQPDYFLGNNPNAFMPPPLMAQDKPTVISNNESLLDCETQSKMI